MTQGMLHNTASVAGVLFARLRFVAVFLVAAMVVGYWDTIRNYIDKWTRPAAPPQVESAFEYYCVMHPYIVRNAPGNCPTCGMPLAERKKGEKTALPKDVLARVQLTPNRVALAGIQTSSVEPRKLVRQIHAVGVLDYDETTVAQVSARATGHIDKLFVSYAGQEVTEGQKLYSLYSPEVYTAQRDYLQAQARQRPAGGCFPRHALRRLGRLQRIGAEAAALGHRAPAARRDGPRI